MDHHSILSVIHQGFKNRHCGKKIKAVYDSGECEIFSVIAMNLIHTNGKIIFSYNTTRSKKSEKNLSRATEIFLIDPMDDAREENSQAAIHL